MKLKWVIRSGLVLLLVLLLGLVAAATTSMLRFAWGTTDPRLFTTKSPTGYGEALIVTIGFMDRGWNFYVRDREAHANKLYLVAQHYPYADWGKISRVVWSQDGSVVAVAMEGDVFQWAYDYKKHQRLYLIPKHEGGTDPEEERRNNSQLRQLLRDRGGIGLVALSGDEPNSNPGRKVGPREWRKIRDEFHVARSESADWFRPQQKNLVDAPE